MTATVLPPPFLCTTAWRCEACSHAQRSVVTDRLLSKTRVVRCLIPYICEPNITIQDNFIYAYCYRDSASVNVTRVLR